MRFRVLAIATHPVQYMAPIFRRMAADPSLDLRVAYCSLRGAEAGYDPEFQTSVQWDVPLLDGYSWVEVRNEGSGADTFWGLYNPGLRGLIRTGKFDAVVCYLGYLNRSFWLARLAAKDAGSAFLFGTDAHTLKPRDGGSWKSRIKKFLWPILFRRADQIFVPSTGAFELIESFGISRERITLTPYAVDNEWWKAQSAQLDREELRAKWGARPGQPVILSCAKLQPWKRPMDLLHAFSNAALPDALLIFAGDGPLRSQVESEVRRLALSEQVRFLGFVNQSQLPALYTAADLLVLPSSYEAFAVVVNEAMCCHCPAIVSDQVGAARDLVAPVRPDFVFPAGDVDALTKTLRAAFADREQLHETARRGYQHVETHSPQRTVAGTVEAVAKAVTRIRARAQTT